MNIGYADYQNFVLNTDWQPESRRTVAVSQADILEDIYELDKKFNPSQFENFEFNRDWELESVSTEPVNRAAILNTIYELDKDLTNTLDIIPCPSQTQVIFNNPASVSTKEDDDVELQNHASTWRAEMENCQMDNRNLDPHRHTSETLYVASLPNCEISYPIEGNWDVNPEERAKSNEYNGEKNVTKIFKKEGCWDVNQEERAKSNEYNGEKNATKIFRNQPRKNKRLSCPGEYKKYVREKNKQAARAYRQRKRSQDQELVQRFESLKKKKAMLVEELRFLKANGSLSAFSPEDFTTSFRN